MPFFSNYNSANIMEQLQKSEENAFASRFFKPTYGADQTTKVVMRFLPPVEGEAMPLVQLSQHSIGSGIKGQPFFVGNCIRDTSPDRKCPLCEKYWSMKNAGVDMTKQRAVIAPARKKYIVNALIVENPNAPETEGKVFRYQFGDQTMALIKELGGPHEDINGKTVGGIDVFDPMNGLNFIYKNDKKRKGPPAPNRFTVEPGPISDKNGRPLTEDELSQVVAGMKPLQPYTVVTDTYDSLCKCYAARIHLPLGNATLNEAAPAAVEDDFQAAAPANSTPATNADIQKLFG